MANLHVLLADGDDSFRANAQRALTQQGYLVLPAATAEEVVALMGTEPVDVVLADVALLSPDDVEFVRRGLYRASSLPVLLVAEPRMIAAAANGVRRGALDYMLKPISDFSRLSAMIERAISPDLGLSEGLPRANEPEPIGAITGRLLNAAVIGQDVSQWLALYCAEVGKLGQGRVVTLLSQENGHLQLAAESGYVDREEATHVLEQFALEDFAWQVFQAREMLWESDVSGNAQRPEGVQDMLGVPLAYADHVLGVTLLQTTRPRTEMAGITIETIKRLSQQSALVVELQRVRELAERRNPADRVTGLYVRSHFFELADREFRRSWRFGEPIGALEVDVDDYVRMKTLLGPSGGDEVMQQIARAVRPRLRSIDIVGRIDTDKLGIIVLMATRETLMAVAERLRLAIAEIEVPTREGPWQVTASVGVAGYPREQCASAHDLFALAAQATRAAKRAGRNRVVGV